MMMFVLGLAAAALAAVALYQQFAFRTGTQRKLREIHQRLKAILDEDSGGRLMVFTDNKELMELAAQINRLLEKSAKVEADFCRSEISSRKMLSNISHDMKTPMTVIRGYLEIMRTKGTAEPEMLEKAEQKAQALMELIDSFFSLAKLEAGDTDMTISRLDVCEICRESVLEFYEILTGADFQVEIGLPDEAVYAQGNREALQRILGNLISNVIRYGSEGKYLGVFLRSDERFIYVDVADKGKGIDSAFAQSVFERLFTMEDSRSRSVQGNGLGLTIAKKLAEQMGGNLTLESDPSVRTVFTVSLKRAPQQTGM
ncbi:MAG: HAMP domain-containing histidine kinase [Lachnospiraceae bacterium]|jgi:signal transduction histidine kinase|nr:HAMP domain-containing histidine kinase [Lachnospiraceae bacterium]